MSSTPAIASRTLSEISGSLPGKKPCEARTSATGQVTPRISSAVGLVEDTEGESSSAATREALGQVIHLQVLVGEPEIEVGFRAFEGHVQALEGPREALLQRGGILFLFFGQLFWLALDAGPAAV